MKSAIVLSLIIFTALSARSQSATGSGASASGNAAVQQKSSNAQDNLPPGLQKREQLPPGLSKRDQLPPGLQNRVGTSVPTNSSSGQAASPSLDQHTMSSGSSQSGLQSGTTQSSNTTSQGSAQTSSATSVGSGSATVGSGTSTSSTNQSGLAPTSGLGSTNRMYGTNSPRSSSGTTWRDQSQSQSSQANARTSQSTSITQDRAVTRTDRTLLVQARRAVQTQIPTITTSGSLPIHFVIESGVVTLVGTVSDEQQKHKIVTVVEDLPGVTRVVDQLQVTSASTTESSTRSVGGTTEAFGTSQGVGAAVGSGAAQDTYGSIQGSTSQSTQTPGVSPLPNVLRGTNGLSDATNANRGSLSPTSRTNNSSSRVYDEDRSRSLPPGLEKRDELPPGLEKRDQLPPGLEKRQDNSGKDRE